MSLLCTILTTDHVMFFFFADYLLIFSIHKHKYAKRHEVSTDYN